MVGLAVDGGGMRGVVTGAMLIGLRDAGLDKLFDRHYGCSAGALNVALFGTGGSWAELSLYYDDLAENLVGLPTTNKPAFDMGYLSELQRKHLLDHEAMFAQHDVDLRFPVTDIKARASRLIKASEAGDQLLDYLLAGCWLPYLAGPFPSIGGDRLCDGYILEPSTAFVAALDGCTHVVALSPKAGRSTSFRQTSARMATAASLERVAWGLGLQYLKVRRYQATLIGQSFPPFVGRALRTELLWLSPQAGQHAVEPMTRSEKALLRGARAGYATVTDYDWTHA